MVVAEQLFEGSCQCQKVRFSIRGQPGGMTHCHCTDCRKMHGAAFATYIDVPREQFSYVRGEENLRTFTAESGTVRAFCQTCGSSVLCWSDKEPGLIEVAAGTLDTPYPKRPESHIWVRSKAPWFDIRDGLPQNQTSS